MADYKYIVAPMLGWIAAQAVKFAITLRKDGISWGDFIESGGMPSSHASFMLALLTLFGIDQGISSPLFGLAFAITAIVVYDSFEVRRTVGDQCDILIKEQQRSEAKSKFRLHVSRGHTPLEVFVGSVLGILVGFAVNALF
jgi:uncharacterized protein